MFESPLLTSIAGFIDGRWCAADSGQTIAIVNPATSQKIADVPRMGRNETDRAVEAAAIAMKSPASIEQRRAWLDQVADLINAHREELGRIITAEHGKPWNEAQAEADYAASFFRYYADCIQHLAAKPLKERPRDHAWTVHYRAAGVAALITPWNFPLAMLAKKFSAALASDCCCVIKPSSKTPLSMIALFSLLEQVDLPAGKANLLIGPAKEISDALCEHSAIRVISFTGSTSVGRTLAEKTARQLKRLSLELGGNAPFIVFDDADLDSAVDHLISNKFRGSGQTCVCANRVYVHRNVINAFADKVVRRVEKLTVADGMQEGTDVGPLIDTDAVAKVQRHIDDAISLGARLLTNDLKPAPQSGTFFSPAVLQGVTAEMTCVNEETFGPVVPLIEFHEDVEVVEAANDTEFGLAAYVFTSSDERAERVIAQLQFGHVGHNSGTGPTAEAPFGGMKQSGFGREGGLEGLHDFIEPQTVASK